jgi:hypothetical protein
VVSPARRNGPGEPALEAWITYNPVTGRYGFSFQFEGLPPHYRMESFRSLNDALAWADPWEEWVWEAPRDADERRLLVSRKLRGDQLT